MWLIVAYLAPIIALAPAADITSLDKLGSLILWPLVLVKFLLKQLYRILFSDWSI